jgi:hypothetical protein
MGGVSSHSYLLINYNTDIAISNGSLSIKMELALLHVAPRSVTMLT